MTLPAPATAARTLERLEWESAQEENSWWHEHAVAGLQGRTYAETGDLDAVFAKMRGAHEQVGGWLALCSGAAPSDWLSC